MTMSSESTSSLDTDAKMFLASETREYAQGTLDHQLDHADIRRHAGIVQDEEVEVVLNVAEEAYEPHTDEMPDSFWETKFAQNILKNHGTKTARKALNAGNFAYLDYLTGMTNYDPDISGINTLMWIMRWLSRTASMNILAGHMGTGKTDMALLFAQVWVHHWTVVEGLDEDEIEVISNITSCPQVYEVESQQELVERLQEDKKQLVLIDEASSNFSAGTNQHDVEKQFKRTTRMIRKHDGYLLLISHREDARDVHKDVRVLSDIIYKESQKTAKIYEGTGSEDPKKTLSQIPQTDWEYDTLEESEWEWDLDDDDEDINWDEFWGQCLFEKDNGERCGNENGLDSHGFCAIHDDSDQAERVAENEDKMVEFLRTLAQRESKEEDEEQWVEEG
ncbi:zonular occludens toxin domain-containing protein [Halobacterium noricense]|uniref:zonular occludens toxin domain-containing protein n=1 Tax=Halobacterium noricense TaxID=223182 RepID=UPI001E574E7E|nr:zonular occludens toxin domain-containing protein [Halobacterium noricense]UHH25606.1 hypothetical protein LT974_01380 [Halobacterium noricense]